MITQELEDVITEHEEKSDRKEKKNDNNNSIKGEMKEIDCVEKEAIQQMSCEEHLSRIDLNFIRD